MWSIFIETLFGFFALFIITKLLGKTQIRQLTPFDFISALILGELVGNALYDDQVLIRHIGFSIFLWGGLIFLIHYLTLKFKGLRALLEGKPTIVIMKGKLQREAMAKSKIDINELLHLLRMKDVFSVSEVDYAILETDGTVSVLKKTAFQNPDRLDLNLPLQEVKLPVLLINDGEVIDDNLTEHNLDLNWLEQELKKQNVQSIKDVFYAEYKKGENLYIQSM